jgi:hypothetical protein
MPKPVTFKTVHTAMKDYKERAGSGGKCDAWADFAEHSRKRKPRQSTQRGTLLQTGTPEVPSSLLQG